METVLKERIFFDQSGGGVTVSGGEPLAQFDFTMALLEECKKREINTAIDTCGFVDLHNLLDAVPLTDIFLYDIKHMDPARHREYTGVDNEVIKSNLIRLGESGVYSAPRSPSARRNKSTLSEKQVHSAGDKSMWGDGRAVMSFMGVTERAWKWLLEALFLP